MQFSSLTFVVTEDCNFRCSYCYQQKRNRFLDISKVEEALDFFYPFLKEECYIHFYGGEPLMAFDLIQDTLDCIQELNGSGNKTFRYTISTNGSLLTDEILDFLSRHNFSVLLSFDGLAQDLTKQEGSFERIVANIKRLLKTPDIELETNSVFTPETIGLLSRSIQLISELGVQKIDYALAQTCPWEQSKKIQLQRELTRLRKWLLSHYKKTGNMPLRKYKDKPSRAIFRCDAGRNRLALTPEGKLWGCTLFADYFKGKEKTDKYAEYCFGDLQSFVKQHKTIYPEVFKNYSNLRTDRFYTSDKPCKECSDLYFCGACPVDNLYFSSDIKEVAGWKCEIKKISRANKLLFWEEFENRM